MPEFMTCGAIQTHESMNIHAIPLSILLCHVPAPRTRAGVLEDGHLSGSEELFEAVGELIMDSVPGCTEEETVELCSRLFRIITGFVSYATSFQYIIHIFCLNFLFH